MEISNFMEDENYYKKDPDNDFQKHSTYGLNLEGIKKYYLTPDNNYFNHQEKLRAEIQKRLELHEQMKRHKISIASSLKDNSSKFDDLTLNKNTSLRSKTIENSIRENQKKKESDTGKSFKNIEVFPDYYKNRKDNKSRSLLHSTLDLNKNRLTKRKFENLKLNKMVDNRLAEIRGRDKYLPKINPRPILVDYCLTYSKDNGASLSSKNTNGYKNLGCNGFYMGESYNPDNYEIKRKNRTKRNVFGTLFPH